jgi:cytochrome c oxidase subunit 2
MKWTARIAAAGLCAAALGGCRGWQSALDPQGPQARTLADLIWMFTAVCTVVYVLVLLALLIALARRHYRIDPLQVHERSERRIGAVIAVATAATFLTVIALTLVSYLAQRKLYASQPSAITIRVTGNQWWWDVRYEDPRPDRAFTTANEIHVPVGLPVKLKLEASDVIHSFWVPNLAGKMDLIPGWTNELQFTASNPGVYRGQCAEFCGVQHAHMALLVVAHPPAEFAAWREAQIKPALPPTEPERIRGQQAFLSNSCVMCHTVRGTPAGGRVGPDLTHVASRRYIASGMLETSRGNLGAWIADPQGIKPGTNMPTPKLGSEDLTGIIDYLAGLR